MRSGNTRQISQAVHWCFTLNNPIVTDIDIIIGNAKVKSYVVQDEVGESGTPHLQGYIAFIRKLRPMGIFEGLSNAPHWEICRNIDSSKTYCSDPDKRAPGGELWENCLPEKLIDYLQGKDLHPWQSSLINIIKEEPNQRTIHWVYEMNGNTGKSVLCRHLVITQAPTTCTYVTGSAANVKYALAQMKVVPKLILVDYVRSQENFISYQMLEEVKNGMFFSTKYESSMKIYNPPHLVVMANFPPDITKLSMDRWRIWKIVELELVCFVDQLAAGHN